jgi:hypothetical protein
MGIVFVATFVVIYLFDGWSASDGSVGN